MIHVFCMAQFVDHEVAHEARLKKQQAVIDTDRTAARMTSPAGFLTAHVHSFVRVTRGGRQAAQLRRKVLFCDGSQAALQRLDTKSLVTGLTEQAKNVAGLSVANRLRVVSCLVYNAKHAIDSR